MKRKEKVRKEKEKKDGMASAPGFGDAGAVCRLSGGGVGQISIQ